MKYHSQFKQVNDMLHIFHLKMRMINLAEFCLLPLFSNTYCISRCSEERDQKKNNRSRLKSLQFDLLFYVRKIQWHLCLLLRVLE